jgi:LPXTG-motif cell wall-anchored protein
MEGLAPKTGSTTVTILAIAELVMVGLAGYFLSTLVGSPDTANDMSKTLLPVTGILGGIVLLHTLLWYFYFTYHPLSMNLYFLMSTAVSMIVSLTALSIALIQRS